MLTLTSLVSLGAALAQPFPASARVSEAPESLARPAPTPIELALASVPADAPLALLVPSAERLLARGREALAGAVGVPELPPSVLALAQEAGVDVAGAVLWLPGLDGTAVFRVGLGAPERFATWAARAQVVPAPWSATSVHALPRLDGEPLACTVRGGSLWCQLGVGAGAEPLAQLRRALDPGVRRLASSEGVARAAARLRADADLYAVASPGPLAERVAARWRRRAREEQPFAASEPSAPPAWAARADAVRGAAFAARIADHRVETELELTLSPRAALAARAAFSGAATDAGITDWARTPALGHLVLRLEPAFAAALLDAFDLALAPELLSGALGVMALGLDTESRAAKVDAPGRWDGWPFVFPMAAAVGLAGPAVDRARVARALAPRVRTATASEALFHLDADAGPIEGRWVAGALLVGTGPGGAAAAQRRWTAARPAAARVEAPFLEGELGLAALQAALVAGSYGRDTHPLLRDLERWARDLRPVALRYPRLRVEGRRLDGGARLRLTGVAASL